MEKEKEEMFIGVFDIYGFEIFEVWLFDEKKGLKFFVEYFDNCFFFYV